MSGQCLSVPWNSYNLKFHPWSLCQPFQSESVVFSPPVTQCSYLDHLPGGVITPRTHMPPKILLATLSDHTLNILIESSPSAWAVPSQPSHPVSHDSNQTLPPPPAAASMSCSPQYTGQDRELGSLIRYKECSHVGTAVDVNARNSSGFDGFLYLHLHHSYCSRNLLFGAHNQGVICIAIFIWQTAFVKILISPSY